MSRRVVWLLALVAGVTVANLYYAQPLLHLIGRSLGVSPEDAGLLVAASQLGYAVSKVLMLRVRETTPSRWELALNEGSATGLVSWLESAPPGRIGYRRGLDR